MKSKPLVIVTGSSGLIGFALCNRLSARYHVVGFDREGPPHPPVAAEAVPVDLTDEQSVEDGLEYVRREHGEQIASIVHLAAYYDFSGEPSPLYERVTVEGTRRLLRNLRHFEVEQFVFSSTMLVHAPCEPGEKIDEESPLEPKWEYPQSKVLTEELIRREHGGRPAVLMRVAGVYDDLCHSIPLAHQIQRIHERWLTSHVFPGDTSRGQAFVHLEDLLDAIELAVDRRRMLPPELTLLIGEPETLSYEELQQLFAQLIHGEEWTTRQIPKAVAKTGAWVQEKLPVGEEPFIKPWMIDLADDHYELDIRRAREQLRWEPRHTLRETVPKMIEALKRNPAEWYRENKLKLPEKLEETCAEAGVCR